MSGRLRGRGHQRFQSQLGVKPREKNHVHWEAIEVEEICWVILELTRAEEICWGTSSGLRRAGIQSREEASPAKGLRSEGELPPEVVRKGRVDDQKLEKELETTMFEQVMEDNRKLREELMRLQRAQTGQQQRDRGSGGERRPSGEREREPHRQGRLLDPHHHRHHHGDSYDSLRTARGSQCLQKQSIRASRNEGVELPPWPFEMDEQVDFQHWGVGWQKPEPYQSGGGRREVPTPQEARVAWLEREVDCIAKPDAGPGEEGETFICLLGVNIPSQLHSEGGSKSTGKVPGARQRASSGDQ